MKLLLLAFGSRGDVQPLLPLSAGLLDAGYEVQIGAGTNFKSWIESKGIGFVDAGIDIQALMNSDVGKEWIENSSSSPFQEARNMKRMLDANSEQMGSEMVRICQEAEVLISNLPTFGMAQAIAELQGKKHIRVMLAPLTPSNDPANTMVPMVAGRKHVLNRLSGYIGIYFTYWVSKETTNTFRQKLGLKSWGYGDFARAWNQMPVLYGLSPRAMPRNPQWNDDTFVTGFWFDKPEEWSPPAPLATFLQAHPKPVYIGFGSMATKNPQATLQIMVDALKQAEQAGIIYSGWAGLQASDLPDNILLIEGAPHSWLFPRMAAVIHHGGAGTTAAGMRAGVPATIVSHMADQPYWGRRVYELGVGHKPIARHELTTERLAEAIRAMTSNSRMKAKAAELGALIRQETGVANAVKAINKVLRP